MTRRRAVAILVLVVGGLVAMSLSTIVAGTAAAPALYAQLSVGNKTLDVWRDTKTHDLTFHWDDANSSVATRYLPRRFVLAELSDGEAVDVTRYPSDAAAWRKIHALYGVTWQRVRAALSGGTPSPSAPTAGVKVRVAAGPAIHALVRGPVSDIGVWRDGKDRITFDAGQVWRYDPSTRMLTQFAGASAAVSIRYLSDRTAWAGIHRTFGITKERVMSALASGLPAPEPIDYRVPVPHVNGRNYRVVTDYGRDVAQMSKETGLALPRLASLGGYPLVGAETDPEGEGEIDFGSNPDAISEIRMYVEFQGHGDPPTLERRFAGAHHWYRAASTRYAVDTGLGGVGFSYGGEWVFLDVSPTNLLAADRRHALTAIVRAIVTAPLVR